MNVPTTMIFLNKKSRNSNNFLYRIVLEFTYCIMPDEVNFSTKATNARINEKKPKLVSVRYLEIIRIVNKLTIFEHPANKDALNSFLK